MKQVNLWLDDDIHMLLVKEAARAQLETGKILRVSTLAAMILKQSLNGKPDNKQDDKQEPAELSPESPTEENDNPFADLNFDT